MTHELSDIRLDILERGFRLSLYKLKNKYKGPANYFKVEDSYFNNKICWTLSVNKHSVSFEVNAIYCRNITERQMNLINEQFLKLLKEEYGTQKN